MLSSSCRDTRDPLTVQAHIIAAANATKCAFTRLSNWDFAPLATLSAVCSWPAPMCMPALHNDRKAPAGPIELQFTGQRPCE